MSRLRDKVLDVMSYIDSIKEDMSNELDDKFDDLMSEIEELNIRCDRIDSLLDELLIQEKDLEEKNGR